ncbi:helix-turn-helix domain-containing protein [Anaerofustis stercorihominis]|uniref:DNA-binding helix-turn-helix protein n=2 Tax=Anaerofustis stercorihominis TaxID=214853 RepID=B1C9U6_9FIRM|nr:helix-turn-helix transcriptional regulator [Anaerofustis stercorihominis]EDS72162.1 DNA-binding helix-turn-helix protein [Anaerofustis stercorihominis DSM 17244]MCQ4795780.1 helix-turn-helix domain-containing protein [Anaerofustis stercorihominis]RGD75771.1 XRE family transcriptional regulator [Anaerofustis stercorihominis]
MHAIYKSDTSLISAITKRIIRISEERKISIHSLAESSGIPPTTVYSLFDGKSQNPGIGVIYSLSRALDMKMDEFFSCDEMEELYKSELK